MLRLPTPQGALVGLLRGNSELVVLSAEGQLASRQPAPRGALAMAIAGSGDELLVAGELSAEVWLYPLRADTVGKPKRFRLSRPAVLRGLAHAAGGWVGTDELSGQLVRLRLRQSQADIEAFQPCLGGLQLVSTPRYLVANCLLENSLVVLDASFLPRGNGIANPRARSARTGPPHTAPQPTLPQQATVIRHQGPFWGFTAREVGSELELVAAGVEDAPLDRSIGSFGNIDSFVFGYRVGQRGARRVAALNTSELGLVMPKALAYVEPRPGSQREPRSVRLTAYASSGWLTFDVGDAGFSSPRVELSDFPPGTNGLVETGGGWVAANPLLDAWIHVAADGEIMRRPASSQPDLRSERVRLGEALFFTTLMAPANKSEGKLSRFTCETCHFEGYTDGRIHHTGRGEIRATTKVLLGLSGNRPYFTRALDRDLAQMVNNEFRVAGANSGASPWFALRKSEVSWLLGADTAADYGSAELREALLDFLLHFNHRPNPRLAQRGAFSPLARRGATLFEAHCEGCHSARTVADTPHTRLAPADWEARLLAGEAIVWASSGYHQTGVLPYVHSEGARPSSLRRLYKKAPLFTNGSAPDLPAVLASFAFFGAESSHQGAPPAWSRLSAGERSALLAFLELL